MQTLSFRTQKPLAAWILGTSATRVKAGRFVTGALSPGAGMRVCDTVTHEIETARGRHWRGSLRRLDGAAAARAGMASYAARRVGSGKFARVFRRRNAHHAVHVRTRTEIYRPGRALAQVMGEVRTAMEAAVSASYRRFVDGEQP